MTHNLTKLLLGGSLLLALGACDDGSTETDGFCDLEVEGDPDCLLNGECNVDDPNDPDCEPCDYTPDAEECQPDPCEGANPPPECDPFEPGAPRDGGTSISATIGYDPDADVGRSWMVSTNEGDVESPPFAYVTVTDNRYASTNNPLYRCRVAMLAPEGGTLPAAAGEHELTTQASLSGGEDTRVYSWYEVTFESGNFTVEDAPQQTNGGVVAGCSEKYVDPATWPDGISGPIEAADWTFAWGDMAPVIAELIDDENNNDPNTDYDLYDLYQTGYVTGGGMGKPSAATPPWTAYYASYAFALGEDWKTVDSGNEDDPDVRVPVGDMNPAEGKPARGIYFVTSFNSWGSAFILLDQQGG